MRHWFRLGRLLTPIDRASAAPSMLESQTSGELALIRLVSTVLSRTNSSPNRSSQMRTLSSARSGLVTEPMNGLSEYLRCAYTISKCRLLTGRSTGSHTVPPEWWIKGLM